MTQTIKLKRGTTTPTTSNIVSGEVAVDTSAQKLYINDSGTIKEIGGGGGGTTPTLDEVTDEGSTTTNAITVGNLTSTGIDDNATSTALTIDSAGDTTVNDLTANALTVDTVNGLELGLGLTGGTSSVAVGEGALASSLADGDFNTAVGQNALENLTTGDENTAIGQSAMQNLTTGDRCVAVGKESAQNNNADYTTAVGFRALEENTTGADNTAVGAFALEDNQTGNNNTAIGYSALEEMIDQDDNTAVGFRALEQCQDGGSNTAVGSRALSVTTGGEYNVAVGCDSLSALTTGLDNTAIGESSLSVCTTGAENTVIGMTAGGNITTGSNNIVIGANAVASAADATNEITLGDTQITDFRIPALDFYIDGTGVGINGQTPATELDIFKDRNPVLSLTSTLNDSGYASQSYGTINFSSDDVSGPGAGNPRATIAGVSTSTTGATGAIAFSTTTGGSGVQVSEKMRLSPEGRLGLGTTTPGSSFHINQSSAVIRVQDSDGTNQYFDFIHSAGGTQFKARNNTSNGTIQFAGFDGTTTTEYGRFTATGRFGVGTTAPAYPLEVKAATGASTINIKSPTTTDSSQIFFSDTSNGVGRITYNHNSDYLAFNVNASERLRITSSGNVGIGDTSPDAGLTVHNSDGAVIATSNIARQTYTSIGNLQVSTAGSGGILIHSESTTADGAITFGDGSFAGRLTYEHDNDAMAFTTNTSERLRIDSSGDVGINITNPTEKLHVGGNILATGSVTAESLDINGEIVEQQYSLTGTLIDPSNGTIQYKTLAANTTFTENLSDGEYVLLLINSGSFTVTWPTTKWPGGVAPTLDTSGDNAILLFHVNGSLYGSFISA